MWQGHLFPSDLPGMAPTNDPADPARYALIGLWIPKRATQPALGDKLYELLLAAQLLTMPLWINVALRCRPKRSWGPCVTA